MNAALCLPLLFSAVTARASNLSDSGEKWTLPDVWLYPKLPIALPWSEDAKCRADSQKVLTNLKNRTLWAMQMWDSSAISMFGVLYGNRYHFGNYDECLMVKEPIQTQFCNIKLRAHVDLPESDFVDPFELNPSPTASVWEKIRSSRKDPSKNPRDEVYWGICVPAACNRTELEKGINRYLKHVNENQTITYSAEIPTTYCLDGKEDDFSLGEIGFWSFSGLLIFLVVVSTTLDLIKPQVNPKLEPRLTRLLMSFSVKRNLLQIAEDMTQDRGQGQELQFLYGVKIITIFLIVYDHRVAIFMGATMFNSQKVEEELRTPNNVFLPHGDLLVDTCFFMTGLLVCYFLLIHLEKRLLNPFVAIFSRFTRLAPLYFFIVWFHSSALLRLGSGPAWKPGLSDEIEFCRKNWWANLLFIQNYVNAKEMCMMHAWYLPCDLHFFIMAVILVMGINKNRTIGLAVLYFVTFLSVITPGIITYIYELKPTVIFYHEFLSKPREDATFELLYIKSHTRATVYLLGIITGYILHVNRNSKKRIPLYKSIIGCFIGLTLLFAPMAYGSLYYDPKRPYNIIESSIFASLRRFLWGLAWVLFMMINRFGKIPIIGPLFEWKFSVPLSKATYAIYLIHFIIQMTDYAKVKIPYQFIIYDMFVKGTADLVFSLGYAIALYMALELPFRLIFKELVFSKMSEKTQADDPKLQEVISPTSEAPKIFTVKL